MNNVNSVFETLFQYCGSYFWIILLAIAVIFIITQQKKGSRKLIIIYGVISFVLIFNDFSRMIVGKFVELDMFYRFFWLVPVSLIIAYALVLVLIRFRSVIIRICIFLAFFFLIYKNNDSFLNINLQNMPNNKYLFSDDMLEMSDLLNTYKTEENPIIAAPWEFEISYRTYDASVTWAIGRYAYQYFEKNGYYLESTGQYPAEELLGRVVMLGEFVDTEKIAQAINDKNVDYFIVQSQWNMESYMNSIGCAMVGTAGSYELYKTNILLNIDEVNIDIPGVDTDKNIIFISDMNDTQMDGTVQYEYLDTVRSRRDELFISPEKIRSQYLWNYISSNLDSYQADGIVFGGDMVDYVSETTTSLLKSGFDKINSPYFYIRADHDMGTWYTNGILSDQDAITLQSNVIDYKDAYIMDYGDFYVVGWNNSTSQMTQTTLDAIKQAFAKGKPIILATHVPLNSIVDDGLYNTAVANDAQGRAKLWGEGCLYEPDEITKQFMNLVYDDNTPVVAVLSGHLHLKYTTQLTDKVTEYVFNPAYQSWIARINVK